jgi:hypothetical protein
MLETRELVLFGLDAADYPNAERRGRLAMCCWGCAA